MTTLSTCSVARYFERKNARIGLKNRLNRLVSRLKSAKNRLGATTHFFEFYCIFITKFFRRSQFFVKIFQNKGQKSLSHTFKIMKAKTKSEIKKNRQNLVLETDSLNINYVSFIILLCFLQHFKEKPKNAKNSARFPKFG